MRPEWFEKPFDASHPPTDTDDAPNVDCSLATRASILLISERDSAAHLAIVPAKSAQKI